MHCSHVCVCVNQNTYSTFIEHNLFALICSLFFNSVTVNYVLLTLGTFVSETTRELLNIKLCEFVAVCVGGVCACVCWSGVPAYMFKYSSCTLNKCV